ncbi:nuclear pore complex protein Nup85-like [Styela clava]
MADNEEFVNEMNINDKLFDPCGILSSWGVGNQMMVAAGGDVGSERPNQLAHLPILIHEVRWSNEMHLDITRKLLNESHRIFIEVQEARNDFQKSSQGQQLLVKFSRKYRSVLRACVLEIKSKIEESIMEDVQLVMQLELLSMMEIIWNLCEILFIENSPAGVVLSRLAEWCKFHFTQADDFMEECIQTEQPYNHELYWSTIKCLVLQGRTDDAQNMLKLHPECQSQKDNAFLSMEELLRKMPHFTYYRGQSVVEFEMKWNHWQEECRRRFDEGEFNVNKELQEIAMILCGEDAVFENPDYGGWHQMLISRLLFTQPTVSVMELQHHSKISVESCGGHEHLGAFDHILLAAFELDPYSVIKECSQQLSNWWLAAHLSDIFYHLGILSQKKLEFGVDFHELLILEYATSLMSHESLWRVTIDYLSACSENENNYLSLFVRKIPITSEKKASKLLRICQNRGLLAEAQSICRQMSVSALQRNRLGAALSWCLKCNDSALTMRIAEKMLSEYARTGEFTHIDLLDYLGPSILLSDRLTFLGKYRDFHKLYAEGMHKESGNLLLNLLISNIAPVEFWPSLLIDCLPLLECEEIVFNASDSAKLLAKSNTLDQINLDSELSDSEKETRQKRLELLKLNMSRNLARAIVNAG